MSFTKVEVLVDSKAGDMSLVAVDDTDGISVETTLSVEEAWLVVCELNAAIQKIKTASDIQSTKVSTPVIKPPTVVHTHYNPSTNAVATAKSEPSKARVREAVLESIGANQVRKERYSKPGFPATLSKSGLREYVEPVDVT